MIMRHGETFWNTEGRLQGQTDIPLDENGIRMALSCGEGMKNVHVDLVISSSLTRAAQTAELCLFPNKDYADSADAVIAEMFPGQKFTEAETVLDSHRTLIAAPSQKVTEICAAECPAFAAENEAFLKGASDETPRFRYFTDDRLIEAGFGPWEGLICKDEGYSVPLKNFGTYWSEPESPLIDPGVERLPHVAERVEEVLTELFASEALRDKTVLLVVHGCVIRSILYLMSGKTKFSGKVPLNCEVIYAHPDPDRFIVEDGREIFCDPSLVHDYYASMVQE